MAKLTLQMDTEVPEDIEFAVAFGRMLDSYGFNTPMTGEHKPNAVTRAALDAAERGEVTDTPEPATKGGERTRRTKAELEQDPVWRAKNGLPPLSGQAVDPTRQETASVAASAATPGPSVSSQPSGDGEITLEGINGVLRQILAKNTQSGPKAIDIVKQITDGASISPKHCDPIHWPAIYQAFCEMRDAL